TQIVWRGGGFGYTACGSRHLCLPIDEVTSKRLQLADGLWCGTGVRDRLFGQVGAAADFFGGPSTPAASVDKLSDIGEFGVGSVAHLAGQPRSKFPTRRPAILDDPGDR